MLHEYLIRKEDAEVFDGLIPSLYREELERGNLYGVATFDDMIDPEHLVGVTVVRVRYTRQEIVWIALCDRYEGPESAADLIRIRTESARGRGCLLGTFSEFPAQETLRVDYFAYAGFSYKTIPSAVGSIYPKAGDEMELSPMKKGKGEESLGGEDDNRIVSLRDLTEKLKESIEEGVFDSERPVPLAVPVDWASYDPDSTVFFVRDGIVEAGLFVVRHRDFFAVEAAFGVEKPEIKALIDYLRINGSQLFCDTKEVLAPTALYSCLIGSPENMGEAADAVALAWFSYERVRKKRGHRTTDTYLNAEDIAALGLDRLDFYDGYPEYPEWGRTGLLDRSDCYCSPGRETEAVFDRYREQLKSCSEMKGKSIDDTEELLGNPPEFKQKMIKVMDGFRISIVEKMIRSVEKKESFKNDLKEEMEFISGLDEKVIEAEWAKIRKLPNFSEIKEPYEKAIKELKKQMSQMTDLSTRIALLYKQKELKELKDIIVDDVYFSQIRTIGYYIDSIESYLQFLYDGTPIGAMQGVFVKEKLHVDVVCPDPAVRLEDQLWVLDDRFKGIAPWERDHATVFLTWQMMQKRKGNTLCGSEKPFGLEECRKRLKDLESKKSLHPELFREPLLTSIAAEIPELVELFGEAYVLRNDMARLYRDEGRNEKIRPLYVRANAIFNTLLRRSCFAAAASRMTIKELIASQPDYRPCDYEYSLREAKRIVKDSLAKQ